jgi:hypothetical protein
VVCGGVPDFDALPGPDDSDARREHRRQQEEPLHGAPPGRSPVFTGFHRGPRRTRTSDLFVISEAL